MTYRKCNGSVSRRKFLKGLAASGATIAVGIASAARIQELVVFFHGAYKTKPRLYGVFGGL